MHNIKVLLVIILFVNTISCFPKSKVKQVIDGDTFIIETGERVRLVGINAPELKDIYGIESKKYLADLIEGKNVDLVSDSISREVDVYQRLLRYVYLNGEDVNHKMILDGYAFAFLKYKFQKEIKYKEAQILAKNNGSGLWGNSTGFRILDSINEDDNKDLTKNNQDTVSKSKIYIVGCLILILILFIIYYYFKK